MIRILRRWVDRRLSHEEQWEEARRVRATMLQAIKNFEKPE